MGLARGRRFETTHWSLVLAAGDSHAPGADQALAALCEVYWFPIYAYIRRRGHDPAQAEDLTQGFFARVLEKRVLRAAAPERGRFRSFLLACARNYLANEWDRSQALKRGGGRRPISLDELSSAEDRYRREPGHTLTPEALYERRWALTLLDHTLTRLHRELERKGDPERAARLSCFLTGGDTPYREVAAELDMSEAAVKVAVHRMRRRFAELLRAEVEHTVGTAELVDEELRHLFSVLDS